MGKFLVSVLVICAVVAGVGMYYLQVYHYYFEVEATGTDDVMLTPAGAAEPAPVAYSDFNAIDADSSPIRYRACFTTSLDHAALRAAYQPYARAEPRTAPNWFNCFDAEEIGAALQDGRALAFLGTENVQYGIDRIVAVFDDGRGFAWHQINRCGEVVFDGQPVPEDCPTPPEPGR